MSIVLAFVGGLTALFLTGYLFALVAVFVLDLVARVLCAMVDGACAVGRSARGVRGRVLHHGHLG